VNRRGDANLWKLLDHFREEQRPGPGIKMQQLQERNQQLQQRLRSCPFSSCCADVLPPQSSNQMDETLTLDDVGHGSFTCVTSFVHFENM